MALAGCSGGADEVNTGVIGPAGATPTTTVSAPVTSGGSGASGRGGTKQAASCTNRIDYAGDPRSNAEINSIGERTGTCPPVRRPAAPAPAPGTPNDPSVKCTDKINYAGDPRSNAEINSIGEQTGSCPPVQR